MPEESTRLQQFVNGAKQELTVVEETHVSPSSRQRRIRRRKEWTRRSDNDGTLVWHYQAQSLNTELGLHPSYELNITMPEPLGSNIDNDAQEEPSPSSDPSSETHHVTIEVEESALGEVSRQMQRASTKSVIEIVPVSTGSAVSLEGPVTISAARAVESVRTSQLDFPTKIAHFISSTAAHFKETAQDGSQKDSPVVRFHVVRATLLRDSVHAMAKLSVPQSRGAIRVDFVGEQGIDAGGVYREWVELMNKAIVTPDAGIFTCVNSQDQTLYLNGHSHEVLGDHHLAHFLVAGRLLGRALLEGNTTGFHLALPLLKIILGLPVNFHDLESFDPGIYKGLKWLLNNDGVDLLGLDFTVTEKLPNGEMRSVELIHRGSEVAVTDANKLEYIDRKLKHVLFESVSGQLRAFLQGLYEVIPLDLLMVFDAEELDYVLSGTDDIDVDDWEAHTLDLLDNGGTNPKRLHLPCYDNFWKVVRELSAEERRRLLQFTTGSTRPPPGGFGSLTSYDGRLSFFTLRGVPVEMTRGNLQSHACFNRLDLPTYWSLKSMRQAVHAAISCDVDGFTID